MIFHSESDIRICSMGALFIVAYNLLGSIFRGLGDSVIPLITVAIACVLNIAGDLLLVAVIPMGAAGAAIATVFAQASSVLLSFLFIRKRALPFSFGWRDIRPDAGRIGGILKLGVPIALQEFLVSLSFLAITAIVNGMGVIVSAGVGVAEKLCGFVMLVPSAFSQAMSAFVAQNMGAGRPDRARKALYYGIASSLAVGILMAWLNFFHGDLLADLCGSAYPDATLRPRFADGWRKMGNGCFCWGQSPAWPNKLPVIWSLLTRGLWFAESMTGISKRMLR